MQVGVRMAAIDVAFARDSRVQLAAFDRGALEVDRRLQRQKLTPRSQLRHDERLGEIAFGEILSVNRGRLTRDDSDRLRAELYEIRPARLALCEHLS